MKKLLFSVLICSISANAHAQGSFGRSNSNSGGSGLSGIGVIEHRPDYPESIQNYIPPEFALRNPRGVFKASGWYMPQGLTKKMGTPKTASGNNEIKPTMLTSQICNPFYELVLITAMLKEYINDPILNPSGRGSYYRLPKGYVVYKKDTIRGYITIDRHDVYVEQPVDSGKSFYYSFKTTNTAMKCVTIYNKQNKSMTLVRLNESDKKLWRVVHQGKVCVYDDKIGFIYEPEDVNKDNITIIYNGEVETLTTFFGFDVKRALADYMNEAYSLKINPVSYTWRDLLVYIDKLD